MQDRKRRILPKSANRVQPVNTVGGTHIDLTKVDWNNLRLFRLAVRSGSLRAAAIEEGISINTLRTRMGRLERQLGLTLLVRSPQGVTLTAAGEALAEMTAAMNEAAFMRDRPADDVLLRPKEITIGCSEGIGTLWLTPRILELQRLLPGLTVNLQIDYNLARDRTNEADISLTFEMPQHQDLLVTRIATLHFLPFAAARYIDTHGVPQCVDELRDHRIVEHIGPGVRSELLDYLIGTDRSPHLVPMRTNSSLAQLWAVAQGAGIGGFPTYISEITRAVEPIPPALNIRRELRMAYHANARHSPAIQIACNWLRDAFDSKTYPCFADVFVHPEAFPRRKEGPVAQLFRGIFDRMERFSSERKPTS
ncbi:LysR family transcriptional regulator [Sphingobium indicum]